MEGKQVYNCTEHPIAAYKDDKKVITYEPSGCVIRLKSQPQISLPLGDFGLPVIVTPQRFSGIEFTGTMPPAGATLLVSMVAAQYIESNEPELMDRYAIASPDSGPNGVLREGGQIVGTKQFCLYGKWPKE